MQIKFLALVAISGLLIAQQSNNNRITVTVGPGNNPIHPSTCTSSVFGYLEIGGRTNLTATEMGQYVLDRIGKGFVLTIYPETKDGIAVSADCRNATSPSVPR
jgi:hypothetical protein